MDDQPDRHRNTLNYRQYATDHTTMTSAHRLFALALVASLVSFGIWGSAIPGFSTGFSRVAAVVSASILAGLVFTNWIWCQHHNTASWASVFVVAYIVARGTFAPFSGGTQRIGVFFMHVALAVGTTMVLNRADPTA